MDTLKNLMPFVNDQIATQRKLMEKFPEEWRKSLHLELMKKFESMQNDLQNAIIEFVKLKDENENNKKLINELNQSQQNIITNSDNKSINQLLTLNPEELEGIPSEILEELSESARDKTEIQILEIIRNNNGYITLDQLLVRLYKKFGEIFKRQLLTTRLYRMAQSGMLRSLPGKKGVYSTIECSEDNLSQIVNII